MNSFYSISWCNVLSLPQTCWVMLRVYFLDDCSALTTFHPNAPSTTGAASPEPARARQPPERLFLRQGLLLCPQTLEHICCGLLSGYYHGYMHTHTCTHTQTQTQTHSRRTDAAVGGRGVLVVFDFLLRASAYSPVFQPFLSVVCLFLLSSSFCCLFLEVSFSCLPDTQLFRCPPLVRDLRKLPTR